MLSLQTPEQSFWNLLCLIPHVSCSQPSLSGICPGLAQFRVFSAHVKVDQKSFYAVGSEEDSLKKCGLVGDVEH